MTLRTITAAFVAAAGLAAVGGVVHAETFKIVYSGQGSSGTAYVTGDAVGNGEYALTSGTLTSDTLGVGTLTLVAPGSGVFANDNGDNLPYDNRFFVPANSSSSPDGANLDYDYGIVFQTATPSKMDVYLSANYKASDNSTIGYFAGFDRPYGALDSFTVTEVPAVSAAPEPGTWALMIGGVGLAGLALRRRKEPAVATFAA